MAKGCTHIAGIREVTPSALGCEQCLASGSVWLHLRICRSCGHVGCCDDSPNQHATKHFHATGHPVIEGYDPPEGWGWCYVDEVLFDLSNRKTPHNGPIALLLKAEFCRDGLASGGQNRVAAEALNTRGRLFRDVTDALATKWRPATGKNRGDQQGFSIRSQSSSTTYRSCSPT